ncbi:hypothetical protein [Chlamydia caviae]|uniref:Lipoprotein n=1 Tax=Chlamydia caviae (strain ATCC VR-813 / DSM 19441 / 03DC25 / GPIC) TaxID=227941 RepID=Q824G6_CHLCV|nr:hypothetical protein [Chlamydia caviae]AAP04934.1 conserved hypothetical protein [Chlamydia caviae GPIC]
MKRFSFLHMAIFTSLFVSSCSYAPPPRSYILAQGCIPLAKQANSLEFSIAKSIFQASFPQNI